MELNRKIQELEDEIKVLKGEIKSVLVEIREYLLTRCRNPLFNDFDSLLAETPSLSIEAGPEPESKEVRITVGGETKEKKEGEVAAGQEGHRPEERPRAPRKGPPEKTKPPVPAIQREEDLDLSGVLRLARWVGSGIRKVGRERLEKLLEIYHMAGYLSPNLKEVILKLIRLAEESEPTGKVTMKDCIVVLLQLDELLKEMRKSDLSLLSLLFDEEVDSWTGR